MLSPTLSHLLSGPRPAPALSQNSSGPSLVQRQLLCLPRIRIPCQRDCFWGTCLAIGPSSKSPFHASTALAYSPVQFDCEPESDCEWTTDEISTDDEGFSESPASFPPALASTSSVSVGSISESGSLQPVPQMVRQHSLLLKSGDPQSAYLKSRYPEHCSTKSPAIYKQPTTD